MRIQIKRVGAHALPLPKYETSGAAGCDLRANVADHPKNYIWNILASGQYDMAVRIAPGERLSFDCGFAFAIPPGFELQVRGRSGLARHGVVVFGSPGTVDSDYRGPVGITLWNCSGAPFYVRHGDRVAQAVIAPVVHGEWQEVEDLPPSERGGGGFGSTGTK